MDRPVLLVDVDGVLNPWGRESLPEGFREYRLFPQEDEPVRLNAVHGRWLKELAASFDLVWATSWGDEANKLLCPRLGLDELPCVPLPATPFPAEAKVPAIAAFVAQRPAAWIDDLMVQEAYVWAKARSVPTLLVEVDHTTGMTRHHVERLLGWSATLL